MRVFIAINFTPEVKKQLSKTMQELKKESIRGNFTRIENLHLTLAFLGEVSSKRVQEIINIMNETAALRECFQIQIGGLGKFVNRGECLYWCGMEESEALAQLQHALVRKLKEAEFSVDDKPFKPHITLGRRCVMKREFEEAVFREKIPSMNMQVAAINLMRSEHKEGRLTYTSLGETSLLS